MTDSIACTNCGAPIQQLVDGACPYCHTVVPGHEPTPGIIDARGPVWRVILWSGGKKPKKVWKALEQATDLGPYARTVVENATREMPKVVVQDVVGSQATPIFMQMIAAGGTGSLERREGSNWVVAQSSDRMAEWEQQNPSAH